MIFINSIGMKLHDAPSNKKLLQVVTMEPFSETDDNDILGTIAMNKSDAFCENHVGSTGILEESCGKLTKNNCSSTSCCVLTSDNKCLAGNEQGPTFNTDKNGKTHALDYYYFQNKCYGAKCPSTEGFLF
jgi:hypothetical protein